MEEMQLTIEDDLKLNLKLKESMEWGLSYYTEELKELGYTHQAKGNELEVYDGDGNLAGKSYLEKEGLVSTRTFEAMASVPTQVEEISNQLLLLEITLGYTERDIALLRKESLVSRNQTITGQLELFALEQQPSYNSSTKPLKDTLETALNATAVELPELPVTRDNYKKLFDRGYVESPIETLKMGENQYQKFQRPDRNNLLAAAYMTLTQPSLILEKETYDEKAEQFKPVHVYGKSFYRKESGNKRVVESIVIFREENRIIISSHNKDVKDFVKQIKTADQIVYMDKEVGRVAAWLQEKADGHVPLQGINTRVINPSYNVDKLVSIQSLIQNPPVTSVQEPSAQYITSGDPNLTKEHIWKARAATRTYCNPILEGKKGGLWKSFRDFKKHGVLDILGAKAEMEQGKITPDGWNQLATTLQIYRDKRFETFRYLFVSQEGKIQDQLAVCSRLPGKTLANLPDESLVAQVIAHAESTGTKVVLVHNHPSGNTTPSTDDILLTERTEAAFTRSDGQCLLAGHIILDHGSYSLYRKGADWQERMPSPHDTRDPLLKTRNPMEGITVSGPESLELVAQAVNSHDSWKEEGWVPVVFANSRSQVSAVRMYPEDFLAQNNATLLHQLQETARQTGSVWAFPIVLDKEHISQENQKNLLDRMKAGCFTDFYLGEKDGTHKTAEDFNLTPGKNLFDEVGMEQMTAQTAITSTFPRHQRHEMESLGLFVAEDTRRESPIYQPNTEEQKQIIATAKKNGTLMKTPAGLDSILSIDDWVFIRTHEGKSLLKDWEYKSAYNFALSGLNVSALTGNEFQKEGNSSIVERVVGYYSTVFRNEITNPYLGKVILDKEGVKSSLAHGIGKEKAAAYAAVPNIIQNGMVYNYEQNWKGRGYDTAVIIAPLSLGGKDFIGEVIVSQRPNKTGFYLHEVEIKEKLMEMFKTPTERSIPTSSRLIMARHIDKVKNCKVELSDTFEPTSEAILKAREVLEQKKISDWLAIKRVQFPLSLTKSDLDMIAGKDKSVKTRSQFENSMKSKLHLGSSLPEKLLTPAQIREGKHQLPVRQEFMEKNKFFPPMELAKDGRMILHCTSEDLKDNVSQENKPVVLKLTPKQAAVLIDASIKQRLMENRQAKQPEPLNLAAKNKMEVNFFTGLKTVHPQITRKEAEQQYHQVYSLIEKELKALRTQPAIEKKLPPRKGVSMEW